MEFSYGNNDLGSIELHSTLFESFLDLKDLVEFTSIDERHYEIKTSFRLEKIVHTTQERMVCL